MRSSPHPYLLEDRSAIPTASDFDDVYDRLFLRTASLARDAECALTMIYDMGRRSARRRDSRHCERPPAAVLEFGTDGALGHVRLLHPPALLALPMGQYLRKTAIWGGSTSRRFRGSDGREYRWSHRTVAGQEWTCVDGDGRLVAHYNLKPPGAPAYQVSGNVLTIYELYGHLAIELLATLTIMRHIAEHNL